MAGTVAGGRKARDKILARDPDWYEKMGAIGGKASKTGGFGEGEAGRERARFYGAKGGRISRRYKVKETR